MLFTIASHDEAELTVDKHADATVLMTRDTNLPLTGASFGLASPSQAARELALRLRETDGDGREVVEQMLSVVRDSLKQYGSKIKR